MSKVPAVIYKWGPFALVIVLIFVFSSIPKKELPDLYQWDLIVKKSGHMLGYGLLALSFWHGLGWDKKKWWIVWLVAILYAITDEIHQSFVPGRTSSPVDIVIDGIAAGLALLVWYAMKKFNNNRKII